MSQTNLFQLQVAWEYGHYPSGVDSLVRGAIYLESIDNISAELAKTQSHLVMVLDISGSMNVPEKYPLLRQALEVMMKNLEEGLFLSVVLFSTHAQTLCKALPAAEARLKAADLIAAMDHTPFRFQTTNLSRGLDHAFDVIREFRACKEEVVPRLYILTDGELTDPDECYARTEELESLNVEVNSYGFGKDFAFETMKRVMGQSSGGMVKHIRNTDDILETFQRIVQVTSLIVASEVQMELEFAEGVIPGDFFAHRPAPRLWRSNDFQPPRSPRFVLGNIEVQRKYVWVVEARLPEHARPGFKLANLHLRFKRAGGAHQLLWPVSVPVAAGNTTCEKNNKVGRILAALEDLRDNSLEAQIAAYEARIEIAREEKRDLAYIEALESVLSQLKQGKKKEEIDKDVLKFADVDLITQQE